MTSEDTRTAAVQAVLAALQMVESRGPSTDGPPAARRSFAHVWRNAADAVQADASLESRADAELLLQHIQAGARALASANTPLSSDDLSRLIGIAQGDDAPRAAALRELVASHDRLAAVHQPASFRAGDELPDNIATAIRENRQAKHHFAQAFRSGE